jgi:hypothetical protein
VSVGMSFVESAQTREGEEDRRPAARARVDNFRYMMTISEAESAQSEESKVKCESALPLPPINL